MQRSSDSEPQGAEDRQRGAGLVEYVLLLALIALVCVSAISYFGNGGNSSVTRSKNCILAADGSAVSEECARRPGED